MFYCNIDSIFELKQTLPTGNVNYIKVRDVQSEKSIEVDDCLLYLHS